MSAPLQINEQHRRLVLKALLWTTLIGGIIFATINFLRGIPLLATLELVYAGFSIIMLRVINHTPNLRAWTLAFLLPFFSIMIIALGLPTTSFAVFAWVQTIPIISYLLLGLRQGFWVSLAFISLGLLAYNLRYIGDDSLLNLVVAINVGLASLAMMLFSHIYERSRLNNELRLIELASTDSLTGLANRMKLLEVFRREQAHALRDNTPLSLIVLDIDHFKQINDRFGHDIGDQALRHFATLLAERLRTTDLFCRLGGEEFALLLPDADLQQAAQIAETLRKLLASAPLPVADQLVTMTLSAGVASLGEDGQSLDDLMLAADRRTYAAKHGGRNRVVFVEQKSQLA